MIIPSQLNSPPKKQFVTITDKDTIHLSLKIEGLWGENNIFEWKLNPHVNILSGANGSGKSTVLRILYAILTGKEDKLRIMYEYDEDTGPSSFYSVAEFIKTTLILNSCEEIRYSRSHDSEHYEAISNLKIDFFASLDQKAISNTDIQAITKYNDSIKSQIDFDLYNYQIRYTKYLLQVSQKAEKAYANGENITQKLAEIYAQKSLFFDIIDVLFAETDKEIDRESADLQFVKHKNIPLSVYQLATGEKQMLLILLTSLLQNNYPTVYLLDEPEISLHPDWQESLIDNIRKLNPYALVVIATHSPDMIVNGWLDKVVDMRDLLKPLILESKHAS